MGIRIPDELETSIATVMQSVIEEKPPPDGYGIIAHEEGVDLLPANIELSVFEVSLTNVMSREYVLREALEPLRERYDRILIDCMPSLGMMTINALVAADSVIIPSQANYLSTKGLSQLMQSIAKVKRQINPRLSIDGVLLTMVDNRTNNAKSIESILSEEKPNQREKISFSAARIRPLIPEHYSRTQTEEYIVKALQYYQRHLDLQRQNRDAR